MHRTILEMSSWALQACCSWVTLSWQLSSLAQLLLRPAMVHDLPVIQHKTLGASIRGITSFVNRYHSQTSANIIGGWYAPACQQHLYSHAQGRSTAVMQRAQQHRPHQQRQMTKTRLVRSVLLQDGASEAQPSSPEISGSSRVQGPVCYRSQSRIPGTRAQLQHPLHQLRP